MQFNGAVEGFINRGGDYNYLVVMCDTFEYEDYPVYVNTEKEALDYREVPHNHNMQKCMCIINIKDS